MELRKWTAPLYASTECISICVFLNDEWHGRNAADVSGKCGSGRACVPASAPRQGRIHHPFPAHNTCVFGMETPLRGRSGGHTGTAPTVSFGWIARGTVDVVWVDCVCDFVCWENGAHEPTPSVLYFCQPRVD